MKINKKNALDLWSERYGSNAVIVKDFHGNYMHRDYYGNPNAEIKVSQNGFFNYGGYRGESFMQIFPSYLSNKRIKCGWNLHHIYPRALNGTNDEDNLICTNIITNSEAGDKITFRIDNCTYQVHKDDGYYKILKLHRNQAFNTIRFSEVKDIIVLIVNGLYGYTTHNNMIICGY